MTIEDERDALDAFLLGDPEGSDDEMTPLDVASREHATRELRRLARLDSEAAQVQAVYDAERARLDAYLADRMRGITSRREWLAGGLESFMRAVHRDKGTQSIKLPTGTLALSKPRLRVEGDASVIPEDQQPFLVRWKPELNKVEAKERLTPGYELTLADAADLMLLLWRMGALWSWTPGDAPDEDYSQLVIRAAVDETGEAVLGVVFVTEAQHTFKATPAKENPDA
jgi:hypothetical protein